MKRIGTILLAALIAAAGFATYSFAAPKEKKEKKAAAGKMAKEDRIDGRIQRSDKDKSTLVVRAKNVDRTVIYDSSTKWTKGSKREAAEASAFKDGSRVIVLGKFDDQGRLMATEVNLRAPL